MVYVKPRKRTVNDTLMEKLTGNEVKKEIELVEDRSTHKTYSGGLKMRFGTLFAVCSLIIALIVYVGLQGILEFQEWNENWYLARHPLVQTVVEDGYKSSSFKVTINRPLTVEKQPDRTVYMAVMSGSTATTAKTIENKEQILASSELSGIVKGVNILESNQGKNTNPTAHHNDCTKVGMTNEFGYRALDNYCFNSFQESVDTVTAWFKEQLKTKNLSEALCFYATGRATSTCDYAVNFAKLDNDGKLASK